MLELLQAEPDRFDFDAAVTIAMQAAGKGRPGEAIRFRASVGLGFVASDVAAVEPAGPRFRLTTGLLGLTGPGGVLPRPVTDLVNTEHRRRSPALAAFLDLLAQRPLANFAMAGIKYRAHRAAQAAAIEPGRTRPEADGLRHMALALTGYGAPHLAQRLATGPEPILFYAGLFAAYPRSTERLGAILADWLEHKVEIEQFDGTWLKLGPDEVSTLPAANRPGRFNALGVNAAIGSRSWDIQCRIRLRIGPLPLDAFEALQPDQPLFQRLAGLIRAYLDDETGFAINPILAADAVPPVTLGAGTARRLGRNAWLPTGAPRERDGVEAVFEADAARPKATKGGQPNGRNRK
ncbi:type VI secretion system protein [Aliidongia dinghuensis]|uniref:Type VI secretion system protein n=1 Tax=Aliidongia dinghuensis TaxID=1867774 RepID=A0A8J3E5R4_9PROT|nr:type VI secretion system baseplate subunit TssG [Aliidongia dinghuensis]GGF34703.1 type VI secretion system protein [Aliidongia dinghuensis]